MGTGSMTVYDTLLTFLSEDAAIAALPELREEGAWKPGLILDVKLIRAEAVIDDSDPEHLVLVTPQDTVPGWTIDVMTFARVPAYEALGVPFLVADREAALRGEPFVVATSYSPEQIAGILRASPDPAGSGYPFGS